MLRRCLFVAALCSTVIGLATSAHASVHFTQGDLLGMSGPVALTPNPLYADSVAMTGLAGATRELPVGASDYFSLSAGSLAAFNLAVGAGDTLAMIATNDNNQTWDIGIWYDLGAGKVEAFATLASTASSGLSLFIPGPVLDAGVFVRSVITQPDRYHASWNVPEPGSFLVWGALGLVSLAAGRRNRG